MVLGVSTDIRPLSHEAPVRPTRYRASRVLVAHFDRSTSLVACHPRYFRGRRRWNRSPNTSRRRGRAPRQSRLVIYQRIIAASSQPDRRRGKAKVIDPLRPGVPTALSESPRSAAPCTVGATTCRPTSTTTPPTNRPKRSTAVGKRCAKIPSDSETLPTTESAYSCTAATSSTRSMHSRTRRDPKTCDNQIRLRPVASPCPVTIDLRARIRQAIFRSCSGSRECHRVAL